jgi:hypothetical protein
MSCFLSFVSGGENVRVTQSVSEFVAGDSDTTVSAKTVAVNLSTSLRAAAATAYQRRWAAVGAAREAASDPPNSTTAHAWWVQLEADFGSGGRDALRLEPLRHGRCHRPHSCVGLNRRGDCVCYAHSGEPSANQTFALGPLGG